MKLFLTSVAAYTLDFITELVPEPSRARVIFIPTAAETYEDRSFVEEDREKLLKMSFEVKDLDLKGANKVIIEKELAGADVVFVAGGNTFYLLDQMQKSGFDKVMCRHLEQGVVYAGSSAGSVVACPNIEYVSKADDPAQAPDLKDYTGLNWVDYLILPHYGTEKYMEVMNEIYDEWSNKEYEIKKLGDNQVIIVDGNKQEIRETK